MEENREEEILENTEETGDASDETIETAAPAGESAAEETAAEPETDVGEEADGEEAQDDADGDGKKFGKKKSKKEKKDKKDAMIEELNDKVIRQMAEFQNFRNRSEKEKAAMFETGAKSIIEKLLPVIDNFERAFAGKTEEEIAADAFADGMNKVYKQMLQMLTEAGVVQIQALHEPFDPNFHQAVMHVEDEAFGENEVIEEFQKGYMYRENVVRHSMVKVAN